MAPEYALRGHLTYKADVYSFGVVALEIASGKKNSHVPNSTCLFLLDWVLITAFQSLKPLHKIVVSRQIYVNQ